MRFSLSKTPFGCVAALSVCAALMVLPPSSASAAPTETVLHAFRGGSDGAGNLYGTTEVSGASNDGVVFQLAGTGFVPPRPLAMATANAGANRVSVINPATNAVAATIPVGIAPAWVAWPRRSISMASRIGTGPTTSRPQFRTG